MEREIKQMVKVIWQKIQYQGVISHGGECDTDCVSSWSIGMLVDSMWKFPTLAATRNAACEKILTSSTKLPISLGMWAPTNTWFLCPPESISQAASQSVQLFLQFTLVPNTQTQTTQHAASILIGCVYALHAGGLIYLKFQQYTV